MALVILRNHIGHTMSVPRIASLNIKSVAVMTCVNALRRTISKALEGRGFLLFSPFSFRVFFFFWEKGKQQGKRKDGKGMHYENVAEWVLFGWFWMQIVFPSSLPPLNTTFFLPPPLAFYYYFVQSLMRGNSYSS